MSAETGTRATATTGEGVTVDNGLAISVLGELAATHNGKVIDLGGRKQRAVLAVLVLARGDVVPAEQLIDDLWGEAPPPSAAGALHSYVSHLRRSLEPDRSARSRASVLSRQGPGYALHVKGDAVDSWHFERLVRLAPQLSDPAERMATLDRALGLWRGPALADYDGLPWAEAEVARLEGLRDVAREQLLEARLDMGESAVVVPEIERLVGADPLREERWRLLTLALYRSHRQADALSALRRARQTLADELGVDPGPALRELEAEVLAQSPTLDAPARPARVSLPPQPLPAQGAPAAAPGPAAHPAPTEAMVDRDREVADLRRYLDEALAGSGRLALVEGPPGIGKSRLLAEARSLAAERGATVLSARGSQHEREFAFGAVRQLFEPTLAEGGRRALLDGAAASAAGVFDTTTDEGHQPGEGFAVLHGLYWLTVNLAAQGPVLLAVDDLQWCDNGSVRFLGYLLRRLEGLPVLIVATLRTGESNEVEALLAELAHDLATVPVRPGPLSLEGVGDLVRQRLGDPADRTFVAACHRTTSGNPLLLRQLLRALEGNKVRPDASHADTVTAIGSRAISSMVLMRLGRLSASSTTLARAIAVLGDGAELPTVAALTGLDESEVAGAVAALARAEVLRDEHPLGFVHPLVRDAVYRDLPPGEREIAHERAARVLEAAHAAPEHIAAHLLQVPRRADVWVVDVLRQAAATAVGRGSSDGAVTYLQRALAEPPGPDEHPYVLLELGQVQLHVDGPAALANLRLAYESLVDVRVRAQLAQALTRTLIFAGSPGEATAFARRAGASLPGELSDERQGLIALERIGGYMHGLDESDWRPEPVPDPQGEGLGARMLAAHAAWETFLQGTDRARCVELARFALGDRILMANDAGLLWVVAAMVQDLSDDDVSTFWEEALAAAHARGSLFSALSVHLWRGYMLWRRGDLREALDSLQTANDQTSRWGGSNVASPYGQAFAVGVLLDIGDVAGARSLFDQTGYVAGPTDGQRLMGEAEAKILYLEGRHAESLQALDEVRPLMESIRNPVWKPWRSLRAHPLAAMGRRDEAIDLLEEELALVRAWGARSTIGRTLRMLAEMRSDTAVAVAELRESIALLSQTRARLQLARSHQALARCLLGTDEAIDHLELALHLAESCGAVQMRRDLADALNDAGIPTPPDAGSGTALTTTERRMAAMAAEGVDDRGIAQALFVTPHNVELTLARLRARLGAASNDELGASLTGP